MEAVGGILGSVLGGMLGGGGSSQVQQALQGAESTIAMMFNTMMQNVMQQNMQGYQDAAGDDQDYPNSYDGF
jgi:hypothetical protein